MNARASAIGRRARAALLAVAIGAIAVGAPSIGAAVIEVVGADGVRVRLEAPARRIVSLAPHATELLFALGAGSRIVGVSAASDWPAAFGTLIACGQVMLGPAAGSMPNAYYAIGVRTTG